MKLTQALRRLFGLHERKREALSSCFDIPRYPSDTEVARAVLEVPRHTSPLTYLIFNSAAPTTAAPVKQPTGTAIRTMMQLALASGYYARIVEWGCSFDGNTALTPGQVELFETTVAATQNGSTVTAYAAADIQPYANSNAPANTAGTSGVPFNLGTSLSCFMTGAPTEGTVAGYRAADYQQIAGTNQFIHQFPLGREFETQGTKFIRVRVTFGTTVNIACYIIVEL